MQDFLLTKMKKKKMGRPPLPKGESKDALIGVRFKPEDAEEVSAAAKEVGKSAGEAIRDKIVADIPPPVTCKWSKQELHGKSVKFALYSPEGRKILVSGVFNARDRPNGLKSISIRHVLWFDTNPLPQGKISLYPIDQKFAEMITKADESEGVDFKIDN
jgi:hypothetical protein